MTWAAAIHWQLVEMERDLVEEEHDEPEETSEHEFVEDSHGNQYLIDWGSKEQIDAMERAERRQRLGMSPDPSRRSPASEENFFKPAFFGPASPSERAMIAEGVARTLDMDDSDEEEGPPLCDSDSEDEDTPDARWKREARAKREKARAERAASRPVGKMGIHTMKVVARKSDKPLCPVERSSSSQTASPSKTVTAAPTAKSAARRVGARRMRMTRGMTIDSGAADNVIPRRMVKGKLNKIRPSPGSKKGVYYVSASGGRIANEGECDFHFSAKDGTPQEFTFQIAEVNKALCAVSYLVDKGHQVIFDQDAKTGVDTSRIVNKSTGKMIPLVRERNVWVIDAYIEDENDESLFSRRG